MAGPLPFRAMRSIRAVSIDKKIYFYGGVGQDGTESILDVSDCMWLFDTIDFKWQKIFRGVQSPEKRRLPGIEIIDQSIIVFGGSGVQVTKLGNATYNFKNDAWIYDINFSEWSEVKLLPERTQLDLPEPRYFPILAELENKLFLFGGYGEKDGQKKYYNDTFIFTNKAKSNRESIYATKAIACPNAPSERYGVMHAKHEQNLYIFGGYGPKGDLNDLWKFSPKNQNWEKIETTNDVSPEKRYAGAIGSYKDFLVLFGGRKRKDSKINYSDLWLFDLKNKKWTKLFDNLTGVINEDASRPMYHAKSAYCVVEDYLYVLGGEGISGHVSDFWRLNLNTFSWELVSSCRDDDPIFW